MAAGSARPLFFLAATIGDQFTLLKPPSSPDDHMAQSAELDRKV